MLAQGAPLPFLGSVGFLATSNPDSTLTVVAFSIASEALTFRREGDQYRADYSVSLTLRRGDVTVENVEVTELVRVISFRETSRTDESILFQQVLVAQPGRYSLSVTVRDEASGRSRTDELALDVPRLSEGSVATPIPYYEIESRISTDSIPRIVVSPRATATFGRDSVIALYLETYGTEQQQLMVGLQVENQTVWTEAVGTTGSGRLQSGLVRVPVSRIGLGVARVTVVRSGSADTTQVPVFVGLGDELPVSTYEDMLAYLRYFTTTQRLNELQGARPDVRGAALGAFLRATDPDPETAENEALRDYLARLRQANIRFREDDTPGWRTDRGMVFLLLGEPDQVLDQVSGDAVQRGRSQLWEYRSLNLTVEFISQSGFGRWRLTPTSEAQVQAAVRRRGGS